MTEAEPELITDKVRVSLEVKTSQDSGRSKVLLDSEL